MTTENHETRNDECDDDNDDDHNDDNGMRKQMLRAVLKVYGILQ